MRLRSVPPLKRLFDHFNESIRKTPVPWPSDENATNVRGGMPKRRAALDAAVRWAAARAIARDRVVE